jgi:hypothetical protein
MAKATESTKSFLGSGRRHTLVNRVGAARRRRRRRALTGACDAARAAAAARRADGRQGRVPVMIRTSIAVLAAWLPRAGGASGSAAQVLRATNETCTVHANTGVTNGHDVSRPQHLATASACASACVAAPGCCIAEFDSTNGRCYLKRQGSLVLSRENIYAITCQPACAPAPPPPPAPPPAPPHPAPPPPPPPPPPGPAPPPGPYLFSCGNRLARGRNCLQFLNVSTEVVHPPRYPDSCAFNHSFYAPATVSKALKKVHVVHTCHFDPGFTNLRWCVLDEYLNDIFPKVLTMMQTDPAYKYQTQPFLLFLFLNCDMALQHAVLPPLQHNITCPKPELVAQMRAVIRQGRISWQIYPWDALTELYSPRMVGLATGVAGWLDSEFADSPNVTKKKVMSLIDVPGMSASNVPGLAAAGVEAIYFGHISVKVPDGLTSMLFRWEVFNSSVVGMFHPEGYGGIFRKDLIYNEAAGEGLLFAGCLENSEPATTLERNEMHALIARNLSVSQDIVVASSLEAFFQNVKPDTLPVYRGDIGNDWERASMGDPKKMQLLRAFGRIYAPDTSEKPSVERVMMEAFALSAGDHNFGTFYRGGGPWTDYSNHIGPASWDEVRDMINRSAFSMLSKIDPEASHELETELALLSPELPDMSGFKERWSSAKDGVCTGPTLELRNSPVLGSGTRWQLALNCSGAIIALNRTSSSATMAAGTTATATSSRRASTARFATQSNPLAFMVIPGQPLPQIRSLWTHATSGSVVAKVVTNGTTSGGSAGLPLYQHWLKLDFDHDFVNLTVWLGKAPDEINGGSANQQVYLVFNPPVSDPTQWMMDQQGVQVPVTFSNKCSLRHYHCIWSGMSHHAAGRVDSDNTHGDMELQLMSPDVPLVAFMTSGNPVENIMHMDLSADDAPDMDQGLYFNLLNTLNGAWIRQYPWKQSDYWTKYRFSLVVKP